MSETISVRTGARLHFGLLAIQSSTGRDFGGVGLMVNSPSCALSVTRAEQDTVAAPDELAIRLADWRDLYRERCPTTLQPPACCIEIQDAIPMHAGLGSGTQTALALAAALARLAGEADVAAVELARRVGRGARSALGIHGFQHGGLLVEAGKRTPDEISPLVARLSFPAEWRCLLFTPPNAHGLSGYAERSAFARLGAMPAATTDRLCRLVLMDLLPSIATADFATASAAIHEFGRLNGEFFAPIQGGLFADPRMAQIADWLISQGCPGVGQSSWGPTLFALCPNHPTAEFLQSTVRTRFAHTLNSLATCQIVSARDEGAGLSASWQ